MSETVSGPVFAILAFACIGGAIGMLSARNTIHAALWLSEVMLAVAGLYLLLSAEYLAVVQVLIYASAMSVVVLFIIMLTLREREGPVRMADFSIGGGILAGLTGVILYMALADRGDRISAMPVEPSGTAALGELLFGRWTLPLEVAALILLVSLVAAVWWSREVDS